MLPRKFVLPNLCHYIEVVILLSVVLKRLDYSLVNQCLEVGMASMIIVNEIGPKGHGIYP